MGEDLEMKENEASSVPGASTASSSVSGKSTCDTGSFRPEGGGGRDGIRGFGINKEIGYPSNRYLNLINCFSPLLETQPYPIALFLVPGKQQHCSL